MHAAIAAGGMATVHVGRLLGPRGFSRRVAVKRLHPQFARNEEVAAMFEAEARISARVAHANVVPVLDVVSAEGELLLVMDYVHGESLSRLLASARAAGAPAPIPVVVSVLSDVLHGLHAAHEATGEGGAPLRIVHRDVSPQNVLVGADGVARVVDFGIAKAVGQGSVTRDGPLRGKIPYMAPEQLLRLAVDRRVDVYAAGVILWEALAGKRLFEGDDEPSLFSQVLETVVPPPSRHNPKVPPVLDAIVVRALSREPDRRYPDARAMVLELEAAVAGASTSAVAAWVQESAHEALADRQAKIDAMEREPGESSDPAVPAVRAPFASVFFTDAVPPPAAAPVPATSAAGSAEPAPSRRTLWLGLGGTGVVAVGAVASLAFARCAPGKSTGTPADTASVASSAQAPEPSTRPDVEPDASAASAAAPVVGIPPRAGPVKAAPRWCKVFDPDKHIYVMRSMRVARCP